LLDSLLQEIAFSTLFFSGQASRRNSKFDD